jgi:hypothetical protein
MVWVRVGIIATLPHVFMNVCICVEGHVDPPTLVQRIDTERTLEIERRQSHLLEAIRILTPEPLWNLPVNSC